MSNAKLFGKWSFKDVKVTDTSLVDYISVQPSYVPHSFTRPSDDYDQIAPAEKNHD